MNTIIGVFRKLNCVKMTAVILALSFLFTTLSAPFAQASFWEERRRSVEELKQENKPIELASAMGKLVTDTHFSSINIASLPTSHTHKIDPLPYLPVDSLTKIEQYGEIVRASIVPNAPLLIQIQDAHGIYSVQKNIAYLLKDLMSIRVTLVGVEGSEGVMEGIEKWRKYPDRESLMGVAGYLMKEGLLTGVEIAGLSQDGVEYYGVEEKEKYLEQVKAFKESLNVSKEVEEWYKEFGKEVRNLKEKDYSFELKELDTKKNRYEKGEIKLGEWINFLHEIVIPAKAGIQKRGSGELDSGFRRNDGEMSNLHHYLEAYKLEKSLDFNQVSHEQKELLKILSEKLNKHELTKLLEESLAYRLGRIGYREFYSSLKSRCKKKGISISPEMNEYIKYVTLVEGIDKEKLFKEIKILEENVWSKKIGKDAKAKETYQLNKDYQLIGKALDFKLDVEDWKEFEKFGTVPSGTVPNFSSSVKQVLSNVSRFNQLSNERNVVFLQKITQRMNEKKVKVAVLVAGGYHSEGIEELIKEKKISYITIMPRMDLNEIKDGYSPLNAFKRDPTPLEKLFTPEKVTLAPSQALGSGESFQNAFAIEAKGALEGITKTVSKVRDRDFPLTNVEYEGNIISHTVNNTKISASKDAAAIKAKFEDAAVPIGQTYNQYIKEEVPVTFAVKQVSPNALLVAGGLLLMIPILYTVLTIPFSMDTAGSDLLGKWEMGISPFFFLGGLLNQKQFSLGLYYAFHDSYRNLFRLWVRRVYQEKGEEIIFAYQRLYSKIFNEMVKQNADEIHKLIQDYMKNKGGSDVDNQISTVTVFYHLILNSIASYVASEVLKRLSALNGSQENTQNIQLRLRNLIGNLRLPETVESILKNIPFRGNSAIDDMLKEQLSDYTIQYLNHFTSMLEEKQKIIRKSISDLKRNSKPYSKNPIPQKSVKVYIQEMQMGLELFAEFFNKRYSFLLPFFAENILLVSQVLNQFQPARWGYLSQETGSATSLVPSDETHNEFNNQTLQELRFRIPLEFLEAVGKKEKRLFSYEDHLEDVYKELLDHVRNIWSQRSKNKELNEIERASYLGIEEGAIYYASNYLFEKIWELKQLKGLTWAEALDQARKSLDSAGKSAALSAIGELHLPQIGNGKSPTKKRERIDVLPSLTPKQSMFFFIEKFNHYFDLFFNLKGKIEKEFPNASSEDQALYLLFTVWVWQNYFDQRLKFSSQFRKSKRLIPTLNLVMDKFSSKFKRAKPNPTIFLPHTLLVWIVLMGTIALGAFISPTYALALDSLELREIISSISSPSPVEEKEQIIVSPNKKFQAILKNTEMDLVKDINYMGTSVRIISSNPKAKMLPSTFIPGKTLKAEFLKDGSYLVLLTQDSMPFHNSGQFDGLLTLIDTKTGKMKDTRVVYLENGFSFHGAQSFQILNLNGSPLIKVQNKEEGEVRYILKNGRLIPPDLVALDSDKKIGIFLETAAIKSLLHIYEMESARMIATIPLGHDDILKKVTFSPAGRHFGVWMSRLYPQVGELHFYRIFNTRGDLIYKFPDEAGSFNNDKDGVVIRRVILRDDEVTIDHQEVYIDASGNRKATPVESSVIHYYSKDEEDEEGDGPLAKLFTDPFVWAGLLDLILYGSQGLTGLENFAFLGSSPLFPMLFPLVLSTRSGKGGDPSLVGEGESVPLVLVKVKVNGKGKEIEVPSLKPDEWQDYSILFTKEFGNDTLDLSAIKVMLEKIRKDLPNLGEVFRKYLLGEKGKGIYRIRSGKYRLYFTLEPESKLFKLLTFKLKSETTDSRSGMDRVFINRLNELVQDPSLLLGSVERVKELSGLFKQEIQENVKDNLDHLFELINSKESPLKSLQGQLLTPLQEAASLSEVKRIFQMGLFSEDSYPLLRLLTGLEDYATEKGHTVAQWIEGAKKHKATAKKKASQLMEEWREEWGKVQSHVGELIDKEYRSKNPSRELLGFTYRWFKDLGDKEVLSRFEESLNQWVVKQNLFFGREELTLHLAEKFEIEKETASQESSQILDRLSKETKMEDKVAILTSYYHERSHSSSNEEEALRWSRRIVDNLKVTLTVLNHISKILKVDYTTAQEKLDQILRHIRLEELQILHTVELGETEGPRFSKLMDHLSQDFNLSPAQIKGLIIRGILLSRRNSKEPEDVELSLVRYASELLDLDDDSSLEIAMSVVESLKKAEFSEKIESVVQDSKAVSQPQGTEASRIILKTIPNLQGPWPELPALLEDLSLLRAHLQEIAQSYLTVVLLDQPDFLSATEELKELSQGGAVWIVDHLKRPTLASPFLVIALELYFQEDPSQLVNFLGVNFKQFNLWTSKISNQHPGLARWFLDREDIKREIAKGKRKEKKTLPLIENPIPEKSASKSNNITTESLEPQLEHENGKNTPESFIRFESELREAAKKILESNENISQYFSSQYPDSKGITVVRVYPVPKLNIIERALPNINFVDFENGLYTDASLPMELAKFLNEEWWPNLELALLVAIESERKYRKDRVGQNQKIIFIHAPPLGEDSLFVLQARSSSYIDLIKILYIDGDKEKYFDGIRNYYSEYIRRVDQDLVRLEKSIKNSESVPSNRTLFMVKEMDDYFVLTTRENGDKITFKLKTKGFRDPSPLVPKISFLHNQWDQLMNANSLEPLSPLVRKDLLSLLLYQFLQYMPHSPASNYELLLAQMFHNLSLEILEQLTLDLQKSSASILKELENRWEGDLGVGFTILSTDFTLAWLNERRLLPRPLFLALNPSIQYKIVNYLKSIKSFTKRLTAIISLYLVNGKKSTPVSLILVGLISASFLFSPAQAATFSRDDLIWELLVFSLWQTLQSYQLPSVLLLLGVSGLNLIPFKWGQFRSVGYYLRERLWARARTERDRILEDIASKMKVGNEEEAVEEFERMILKVPASLKFEAQRQMASLLADAYSLDRADEIVNTMEARTDQEFDLILLLYGELAIKFKMVERLDKVKEIEDKGELIGEELEERKYQNFLENFRDRLGKFFSSLSSEESKLGLFLLLLSLSIFNPHLAFSIPILAGLDVGKKRKTSSEDLNKEIERKIRMLAYLNGQELDQIEQLKDILWSAGVLDHLSGTEKIGSRAEEILKGKIQGAFEVEILPPARSNLLEGVFNRHRKITLQDLKEELDPYRLSKVLNGNGSLALTVELAQELSNSFMDGFAYSVGSGQNRFSVPKPIANLKSGLTAIDLSSLFEGDEIAEHRSHYIVEAISKMVENGLGERKFIFVANMPREEILSKLEKRLSDADWKELKSYTQSNSLRFLGNDAWTEEKKSSKKLNVQWVYEGLKYWIDSKEFDILTDDANRWNADSMGKLYVQIFEIISSEEVRRKKSLDDIKQEIKTLKIFQIHA